jgi:hypothetical protein
MAHPWMANSLADIKQAMLKEIGAPSIEALFEQIPASHRLKRPLNLPAQLSAESALKRHLTDLLAKNENCEENLNFLGAGCWQHHVPAVVDEIVGRTEFLTPVWGSPQSDQFLGLCRGPCHPHGLAADAAPRSAGCAPDGSRAPVGHPQLLRAGGDGPPYRGRARRL